MSRLTRMIATIPLLAAGCYSSPSTEGKACLEQDACSGDEICVMVTPGVEGVCTPSELITTTGLETSGLTDAGDVTGGDEVGSDGTTDGGTTDSGTTDSGTTDSGTTDSGTTDSGTTDTGTTDSGTTDSGTTDTGTTDSGTTDTGTTTSTGGGLPNGSSCSFDTDCDSGFCWPKYDGSSGPAAELCEAACIPVESQTDWCLEDSDCCAPSLCDTASGFCQ